ncbi:MAG: ABC transporter ATP-binding protein [Xanthobacteraceae bacterium]
MSVLLRASDVSVELAGRRIVEHASIELKRGELTVLIGPNGAGKTTLMRALAGLLPAEGHIELAERPLASYAPRERARQIAYLPQGHIFHWPMSVAAVVALGRHPHADGFAALAEHDRAAVAQALAATAVEPWATRSVTTLSGGERARVALARALATQAPLLLADEPTMSLDPRHQLVVMQLIAATAHDGGAALAIVHDLTLAARFADKVIMMQGGRLVSTGTPREVLTPARIAEVFAVEAIMTESAVGPIPVLRNPL